MAALLTPMSTPSDARAGSVFDFGTDSDSESPDWELELGATVKAVQVEGEPNGNLDNVIIPETPPKDVFFPSKSLNDSEANSVARANNFLRCYNRMPEVPQSPTFPTVQDLPSTGTLSPSHCRKVNLRPFWKDEYERISEVLRDTETKLGRTEYALYLANKEIARLNEFGGDALLGLEEISRQRIFMAKMGAILTRGKFEWVEDADMLL